MIEIKTIKNGHHAGMCVSTGEGHIISVCPDFIREKFEAGYLFMGIKPATFSQALKIVLEHEVCHVVLWYKGVVGHGDLFMEMASSYGHTDYMIRRGEGEDSKGPHKKDHKNSRRSKTP